MTGPTRPPDVSVVVSHYDDPATLSLVLAGLALQTLPRHRFEVVVADDGSPEPPDPGPQRYPVRVVRQDDRGFRLAAARNLGVAATSGRLLCFLDGDTVPGPGYLEQVLRVADELGEAVLVGRRRHADLTGWDAPRLTAWLSGAGPAPEELPEPGWLSDGYRWTDDLRQADDESYRFVIGAVLSVHRTVLERAGGFDERFTGYGGEDWEAVNRCWLAGAALRHVPTAVAWHDGPDFAGREVEQVAVQNAQALALARLLPSPATRPPGLVWEHPLVVVEVDDRGWAPEQALLCVASMLDGSDAGVWLREGSAAAPGGPLSEDPRVHVGAVPVDVLRRCRARVGVDRPVRLDAPLAALVAAAPLDRPGLRVRHARDRSAPLTTDPPSGGPPVEASGGLPAEAGAPLSLGAVLRARAEAELARGAGDGPRGVDGSDRAQMGTPGA